MGIFNLSQVKKTEPVEQETPSESTNVDNLEQANNSKEVTGLSGQPTNKEEDKKIVLDGPLSNIYTQALNIVYAKEGITDMFNTNGEDEGNEMHADLFVYVTDSDSLNNGGLTETTDKLNIALDNSAAKNVLLVVEHNGNVNSKFCLLQEYAASRNVKIVSNRDNALEAIGGFIKG